MATQVRLHPARVLVGLEPEDKDALLRAMCEAIRVAPGMPSNLDPDALYRRVKDREEERDTYLGEALACPHARIEGLSGVRACVATLANPLPWGSGDIRWAILVVGPQAAPAPILRALAAVAQLGLDPDVKRQVLAAKSSQELADFLDGYLVEDDTPLTAADLMRESIGQITEGMYVSAVVRQLASVGHDACGVTDGDRRVVGVLRADDLFTLGMPDFFKQLKSVSFIGAFDPFERYFAREARLKVGEAMSRDPACLPPDATLLEVIFELSVKQQPKVFVVDEDRRLLGVIDRIRVVDRILNL